MKEKNFFAPQKQSYDVVIIGGAKLGSSIAWILSSQLDFDGSMLVIEKDLTYAKAATSLTTHR